MVYRKIEIKVIFRGGVKLFLYRYKRRGRVDDIIASNSESLKTKCYPAAPVSKLRFNPLNPELNPICYLLALLAHHFLHVSRVRVKSLTLRLLMSYIYIYMERLFLMFLDHTQRRSTVGRTPLDE